MPGLDPGTAACLLYSVAGRWGQCGSRQWSDIKWWHKTRWPPAGLARAKKPAQTVYTVCHRLKWQNVYSTMYSQAVTHPSTNMAQCCLTSVIGRELVFSTWYGRRQGELEILANWLKFWHIFNVKNQNVYSTTYSQAVTHPSTNVAQCCLTSVIGRELVFSTWYGRRQYFMANVSY